MKHSPRILVTGAGGPAAQSVFKSIGAEAMLYMADVDPYAAGLYLVPEDRRWISPRGDAPDLIPRLLEYVTRHNIDVFIPTVDTELLPVTSARSSFEERGTRILAPASDCISLCVDKARLLEACTGIVPVPAGGILLETDPLKDYPGLAYPLLVKPRAGAGARGVVRCDTPEALARQPRDGSCLVQTYLPGMEYSVDVLVTPQGQVIAAVPRERLKIYSGIAITARTFHDARLEGFARAVASRIGLTFIGNVQFKNDTSGIPHLLEVNARVPGTMPLTMQSGVDMPRLALKALLGEKVAPCEWTESAVVRMWQETPVSLQEMAQMEKLGREVRQQ